MGSQIYFYAVPKNTRRIKSCCHYSAQMMLLLLHVSLSSSLIAVLKLVRTFFILFSITVFHTFFHTNYLFAYLSLNLIHISLDLYSLCPDTHENTTQRCPQFEKLRCSVLCQKVCFHRGHFICLQQC